MKLSSGAGWRGGRLQRVLYLLQHSLTNLVILLDQRLLHVVHKPVVLVVLLSSGECECRAAAVECEHERAGKCAGRAECTLKYWVSQDRLSHPLACQQLSNEHLEFRDHCKCRRVVDSVWAISLYLEMHSKRHRLLLELPHPTHMQQAHVPHLFVRPAEGSSGKVGSIGSLSGAVGLNAKLLLKCAPIAAGVAPVKGDLKGDYAHCPVVHPLSDFELSFEYPFAVVL